MTKATKNVISSDMYFIGQIPSDEETAMSSQKIDRNRRKMNTSLTRDQFSLRDELNESIPSNVYNGKSGTLGDP